MSERSEAKDLRRLQQELKKAQHDLKLAELQEKREEPFSICGKVLRQTETWPSVSRNAY